MDLELADQEEGVDSAITVGAFVGDEDEEDALLARIRQNPDVEAAEPLMRYQASFMPNDPDLRQAVEPADDQHAQGLGRRATARA